jgi:hypothetical protein
MLAFISRQAMIAICRVPGLLPANRGTILIAMAWHAAVV